MRPLSKSQRASLEMASQAYHEQLWANEHVLSYVYSRGITDETIRRFRLGAVTTPIEDAHRRFTGGWVIPNFSAGDESHVVGLKVRDLRPDAKAKYNQPAQQVARLFNLRALNYANRLIAATEGEGDCLLLEQAGIPAVGIPGSESWTPYRARLFDGLEIIQFADNDKAGQSLVKALATMHAVTVRYPENPAKDVNEQWLQMGQNKEAFRSWALGK